MSLTNMPVAVTGDRPTGPLHLGHYAGSLRNRLELQRSHRQFILVADAQGLTDNAGDPGKLARFTLEVVADYLACGIDPARTTVCLQSALPALPELTSIYMNFVSVARLERNPTIKDEIRARGYERDIPAGFLCYPVAQAADITAFKAVDVPVGEDQLPLLEQTNEIVRRINRQCGTELLPFARPILSSVGRLPGVDGAAKMSKSLSNAIPLTASDADIDDAVRRMFTDPGHLRVADPGKVEGNVVFTYLDAFDPDAPAVAQLKEEYRKGGLGDVVIKRRLALVLKALLGPIRERRLRYIERPDLLMDVLREGSRVARDLTGGVLEEVRDGLGLFDLWRVHLEP